MTVVADEALEDWLAREFIRCGATGFNSLPCSGAGRQDIIDGVPRKRAQVRLEVIVTAEVCDAILAFLQAEIVAEHRVTVCVETVNVARVGDFQPE